jgi:CheY-like chemotaxis protein
VSDQRSILVVDDEPDVREALRTALEHVLRRER